MDDFEDDKMTVRDNFIIMLVFLGFAFIVSLIIIVPRLTTYKTVYISSNLFPLKVFYYNSYMEMEINPLSGAPYSNYIFYGSSQPNGTECISSVEVYNYTYNYTRQTYRVAWKELITDPGQVSSIYKVFSYDPASLGVLLPNGAYTLLCPDIINATR